MNATHGYGACVPSAHLGASDPAVVAVFGHKFIALTYDDGRAERDALVEILDMLVDHTDATVRHGFSDRPRFRGAVYPVVGVAALAI